MHLSPGAGCDLLHAVADVLHQVGLFARANARAGSEEVGRLGEALPVAAMVPPPEGIFFVLGLCGVFSKNDKKGETAAV